jgi:hypothetical protein
MSALLSALGRQVGWSGRWHELGGFQISDKVVPIGAATGVAAAAAAIFAALGFRPGYTAAVWLLAIGAASLAVFVEPIFLIGCLLLLVVFFGEGFNPSADARFLLYRVGPGRVYLFEILVWLATLLLLWKRRRVARFPPTIVLLATIVLGLLILVSAVHGYLAGASLQDAFGYYEWRAWFMTIALAAAMMATVTAGEIDTILAVTGIATAIHAVHGFLVFLLGGGDIHPTEGIRVPFFDSMEAALFASFSLYALHRAHRSNRPVVRIAWALSALPMLVDLVIDRRRSYWLAFVVAIGVLVVMKYVRRPTWLALAPIGFLAIDVVPWTSPGLNLALDSLKWVRSLVRLPRRDTTKFHILDLADVGRTITHDPSTFVFGLGFGHGYTRYLTLVGVGGAGVTTRVAHSVYLSIWMHMGLLGVAAFLILLVGVITIGINSSIRREDPLLRLLIALLVGYAAVFMFGTDLFGNTRFPMLFALVLAGVLVQAQPWLTSHDDNTARGSTL